MGIFDCCLNCEIRTPGCHSDCELYLEDKEKYEKKKDKIRNAKKKNREVNDFRYRHYSADSVLKKPVR